MEIREATRDDLRAIVRLLADDDLGAPRERPEDPLPRDYLDAFDAIARQEGNAVVVAVDAERVVGACS